MLSISLKLNFIENNKINPIYIYVNLLEEKINF